MKALVPVLVAIALQGPAPGAAEPTLPDARLLAGEIIASEAEGVAAGALLRMQLWVHAPARAVWDVIVSCELAFAFVDGLQACAVLEDSGERALVRQVVDQGWLTPTYDFVFESLRKPYLQIDVHLVEGNLRELDARWAFQEGEGGTLVDYQLRIQPLIPAPRFLVRRNLDRGTPDMLACVRGLAGGSGDGSRQQEDLERCPGALPARGTQEP